MRLLLPLVACLPAAAAAGDAPGQLPDGRYVCAFFSMGMINIVGDMLIEGDTYRGPAFDDPEAEEGWRYLVKPDGRIKWGGPLGGYGGPDFPVVRSAVAGEGFAFTVSVQPDGFEIDVTCDPA